MNKQDMPQQKIITVDEQAAGSRIDKFIAASISDYSRSLAQRLIERNAVCVNGTPVTKPSLPMKIDDQICITIKPQPRPAIQAVIDRDLAVKTVFEGEHFLILHKPPGLIVHPPHKESMVTTLVDWLRAFHPDLGEIGLEDRPGIIHRLDKDTSGLIIIPRTHRAYAEFGNMFRNRTIQKTYHAIVQGHPEKIGSIDLFLGRDPHVPIKMTSFDTKKAQRYIRHGHKLRAATTHYKVVEYFENHTLLELKPITGRTHQIRVHLSAIGHPIVGDPLYGTPDKKLIKRHALHASGLSFELNGKPFSFTLDLPDDMQKLISTIS